MYEMTSTSSPFLCQQIEPVLPIQLTTAVGVTHSFHAFRTVQYVTGILTARMAQMKTP